MLHAETVIDPASKDGGPAAGAGSALSAGRAESGFTKSGFKESGRAENMRGKRPRHPRRKRFGLRLACLLVPAALGAAVMIQFLLFAHHIATAKVPQAANADAIVVLTGGHARVNEAVRLLEEGHASRLLISGVHPGTTRKQLAAVTSSHMPLEEGSVDLDRVALNTAGNATETANWVRKNGFKSLLVVTSAYHLPRAQAELSDALPDVELIPYPVFSADLKLDTWYREPATIRLLMREYVKYILARLRNTVKAVS